MSVTTSDTKSYVSAQSQPHSPTLLINLDYNSKFIRSRREHIPDLRLQSQEIEARVERRRLRNLNRKNFPSVEPDSFKALDSPRSSTLRSDRLIPINTHTRQRSLSDTHSHNSIIYKLNNVKPISTEDLMFRIKPKSISTDDIIYSSLKSNSVDEGAGEEEKESGSVDFRHDILYQAINASFGDTTPTNKNSRSFLNTDPSKSLNSHSPGNRWVLSDGHNAQLTLARQRAKSSSASLNTPEPARRKSSLSLSRAKSSQNLNSKMGVQVTHLDIPVGIGLGMDATQSTAPNPLPASSNTATNQKRTSTIRKSLSTPLLSEQDNEVLDTPTPPPLPLKDVKHESSESMMKSHSHSNANPRPYSRTHSRTKTPTQGKAPPVIPTRTISNHASIPNLKSATIDRRNKPPALELSQSTHKQVDNKLGHTQSQEASNEKYDSNLLSPDTHICSNKSTNASSKQLPPQQPQQSTSWATGISSETYFARPSAPNQLMSGIKSKLKDIPKLTRMRSETLPSPSPTTPNSFDPAYANGVGVAVYGYGGGYGGGGYGYGATSSGSQKSPNRLKQRPSSSPTCPISSDSSNGYSVARLKGMLEQHVAQEKNMWHTIASNTSGR